MSRGFGSDQEEWNFYLDPATPLAGALAGGGCRELRRTWRPAGKRGFTGNLGDGVYAGVDCEELSPPCPDGCEDCTQWKKRMLVMHSSPKLASTLNSTSTLKKVELFLRGL
eukprot:6243344-Amphidinium_carterae.1